MIYRYTTKTITVFMFGSNQTVTYFGVIIYNVCHKVKVILHVGSNKTMFVVECSTSFDSSIAFERKQTLLSRLRWLLSDISCA